ncbi:hypothetical protein ACIF8T_38900 [Streptomyces sp. NPDC085946]|uniref:hypothetical protein n=1 Tax=Streptomyces sp. NPDC085946 TaxID=3365744 RepID=UPI0037D8976E
MQVRRWLPDQPTRIGRHDWPDEGDNGTHMRLRAGSIVVLDRQAWRILEINGYTGDRWPDSYEKAWRDHVELWWHANELRRANNQVAKPAPERTEFYKRPVILVLRNENLPRSTPKHWCAPASHDWQVLPEHYAVCRACGELPPCQHGEYRWEGGPRWPEQNGGIPLMVPEGCCMGCAEPIKPRMRTVRFPGPNLWYPDLGEDTAVFHARAACADQVDCYRMQWQTEYTPRPSVPPATPAFPGFEHFVLPRARTTPHPDPHLQQAPQGPHLQQAPQGPHPVQAPQPSQAPQTPQAPQPVQAPQPSHFPQVARSRPEEDYLSATGDSRSFRTSFDTYWEESQAGAASAGSSALAVSEPVPAAPEPPEAGKVVPLRALPPEPHHGTEAQPSAGLSASAVNAGLAVKAAEELGLSLTGHPAFHNAEQAARVIEELTTAVRNIALCLNDPAARARS